MPIVEAWCSWLASAVKKSAVSQECSESLSVGYADYDAVRNHPGGGRFLVVLGHENGQRVLVENTHVALVEAGRAQKLRVTLATDVLLPADLSGAYS